MGRLSQLARRARKAPRIVARIVLRPLLDLRNRRRHELQLATLERRPPISVLMPVYNPRPRDLRAALRSVRRQVYGEWQLCVVDDGSSDRRVRRILERAARADSRIRVEFADHNRGISAATNRALELSSGEYVAFLDHDDQLTPDALLVVAARFVEVPGTEVVYTDQARIGKFGRLVEYFHKPDWSPVYALGVMYIGHLLAVRRDLAVDAGAFDSAYDGVQDFEFLLRLCELTERIEHVARSVYLWRAAPGSVASDPEAKPGLGALQARAVAAHLERCGVDAAVAEHPVHAHRVRLVPAHPARAKFSIVIPSRDQGELIERCLGSIAARSAGANYEVIVVDGGTTDERALAAYERHGVTVVADDERPFNFSRANNLGVARASGEFLVLLNNDTEVLSDDWLSELELYMSLPGVGAVGPLLTYPDGSVQHAGVVLGMRGTADHAMRGFPADADGMAGALSCAREVAAVTAACLCVPRELYLARGGLREEYATHYQDVDLCLRIRASGHSVIYAPRPRLVHHESRSRGEDYDMIDRALLLDLWWKQIEAGDPYYNPALSLEAGDFSLARSR